MESNEDTIKRIKRNFDIADRVINGEPYSFVASIHDISMTRVRIIARTVIMNTIFRSGLGSDELKDRYRVGYDEFVDGYSVLLARINRKELLPLLVQFRQMRITEVDTTV